MHRERIRFCVLASAMALAGCGGAAGPERIFPVFFDNSSMMLDQPAQDIVVRASTAGGQSPLAAATATDIASAEPIGKL